MFPQQLPSEILLDAIALNTIPGYLGFSSHSCTEGIVGTPQLSQIFDT